jgi:hypothetical protein
MTTYIQVFPGIDMSRALQGKRPTKRWLREYLRDNPHKDFGVLTPGMGSYVNGEDAIRHDLTLEVYATSIGASLVAVVNFQSCEPTNAKPWPYQAVVS